MFFSDSDNFKSPPTGRPKNRSKSRPAKSPQKSSQKSPRKSAQKAPGVQQVQNVVLIVAPVAPGGSAKCPNCRWAYFSEGEGPHTRKCKDIRRGIVKNCSGGERPALVFVGLLELSDLGDYSCSTIYKPPCQNRQGTLYEYTMTI